MNYDVVIGIEIHVELKTKTKMFSSAPTSFGQKANTCVSPIDLGQPGVLPCVNKEAVVKAIEACTALHLTIDPVIKFDRKNYYYTDLPKGFQITQQFHPIGRNGYIDIETPNGTKRIRINRIHMEEDTAKQFHLKSETLVDYNRAGTPLIEIVSEPDMANGQEAAAYVENLRQTLYYLGVSDVKMEEGSMRCDVNVSLKPHGSDTLGTKTEIKNLNSIANVQKALDAEVERQTKILDEGGHVEQATRRYDESTKETVLMRKKEGNVDYKFFPEPNIFPIQLTPEFIASVQASLPELPQERKERYKKEYGLQEKDIDLLLADKDLGQLYEATMKVCKDPKSACNWIMTEASAYANKEGKPVNEETINPIRLGKLINLVSNSVISHAQAKEIFEEVMAGKDPEALVEEKGMKQNSDTSFIDNLVQEVLDEQPQSITDYANGKDKALGFLVGQVMKKSKGQVNPAIASEHMLAELKKRCGQ